MKESDLCCCLRIFGNVSPHLSCLAFCFSETSLRSPYGFFLCFSLLLFWDLKQLIMALSSRFWISQRWIHWGTVPSSFSSLINFCGNKDFCLFCLIYSVIMAGHPQVQSSEALEILNFICSLLSKCFEYWEPQYCTEYVVMDRCCVRGLYSFLLWEAEAGTRLTVDSQCVRDII